MQRTDPAIVRRARAIPLLFCCLTAGVAGADGSLKQEKTSLYHEALRPQFHFTARYWENYTLNPQAHQEGWINDVNGLVYNAGEYHLFAQRWWSCWLHAVSRDLVHWEELRPAFGKGGKFGGTQSGGAVVDTFNTSGLSRGGEPVMVAFWSSTDNRSQCISYSRDRGRTWVKYEDNPVLDHPYRDPNVFWHEPTRKWVMILYGPGEKESAPCGTYGFNGESNDAHDLLQYRAQEWKCSVVRLYEDGRVAVADQNRAAEKQIDIDRQQLGADSFFIGSKAGKTEFLNGDLAVVLVYDRALTDVEVLQVQRYLLSEWKLDPSMERGSATLPVNGMLLYLDANQVEAGDAGKVGRWKDLSEHGHDMVQTLSERMPTRRADTLGGRSAIHFGEGQFLRGSALLAEGDDSFSIIALWRREHLDGSGVICEQNSATLKVGRRAALLAQGRQETTRKCYLLFESRDLLRWRSLKTTIPDMFECPDMFPLAVDGNGGTEKWVVVDGSGDYVVGSFDGNNFQRESPKLKGDHGRNFYATMTFACMPSADDRRIQMAWMRGGEYPDMPFNQQISFPCELTLRTTPVGIRLCRNPVQEIEKLYTGVFSLSDHVLKPDAEPLRGVEGGLFDIAAEIELTRSTCDEIVFDVRGSRVVYRVANQTLDACGTEAKLAPQAGRIELRILVDHMSVETFANHGEVSMTNVARAQRGRPPLSLRALGGTAQIRRLDVRTLKSIWD